MTHPKANENIPPDDAKSKIVMDDFTEIECGVDYYGNDDGYNRLETRIFKIIDKQAQPYQGIWEKAWTAIAPGIQTRRLESSTRSGSQEHAQTQSIRIYRSGCPVYIQYRHLSEYRSYESSGSSSHYDEWIKYEAAPPVPKPSA